MAMVSVPPESRSLPTASVQQRYSCSVVERAVNASCGASVADGCGRHRDLNTRKHSKPGETGACWGCKWHL